MDKKNGLIGAILLLVAFVLMFWQSKAMNEPAKKEVKAHAGISKDQALTTSGKHLKANHELDEGRQNPLLGQHL